MRPLVPKLLPISKLINNVTIVPPKKPGRGLADQRISFPSQAGAEVQSKAGMWSMVGRL
jgi:hypothetical protein